MDALIAILEELHPDIDFRTRKGLIDDKILDSFDIITVIAEINDEYDVTIPAHEITPENFNSAPALYRLIESLIDED